MNKDLDSALSMDLTGTPTAVEKSNVQPPLPSEILALSDAETACQFCGVSYLLLSRMETLQKEFRRLERELEERKAFAGQKDKYTQLLLERQARIDQLSEQSKQYQKEMLECKHELQSQQSQIQTYTEAVSKQRAQINHYFQSHTKLLYHTKKTHALLRPFVLEFGQVKHELQKDISELYQTISTFVSSLAQRYQTEKKSLVQAHETQLHSLQSLNRTLSVQWTDTKIQLNKLRVDQQEEAIREKTHFDTIVHEFQQEKLHLNRTLEQLQREQQGYTENLALQEKKIQSLNEVLFKDQTQHQSIYQSLEAKLIESQQALEKEKKLSDLQKDQLQQSHAHVKELEAALKLERTNLEHSESEKNASEIWQKRLRQVETQRDALVKEREATIHAHQHQIKDLQATFQEKYKEVREREEFRTHGEWEAQKRQWQQSETAYQAQLQAQEATLVKWKEQAQSLQATWQTKLGEWETQKRAWEEERLQLQQSALRWQEQWDAKSRDAQRLEAQYLESRARADQVQRSHAVALEQLEARRAEDRAATEEELQMLKETIRQECEERLKLIQTLEAIQGGGYCVEAADKNNDEDGQHHASTPPLREMHAPPPVVDVARDKEKEFETKLAAASHRKKKNIQARANPHAQGDWQRL